MAKQKTETGQEQQDETGPERPGPKEPEQEFRHEVLEDCVIDGIYRAKGDIVHSGKKKVPHCSLIE